MCTLALYFQEFQDYPLIIAANRDEFYSRPSGPPQVLWKEPVVFGGKDLLAGGTWLGVNEHGLVAGILNRRSENQGGAWSGRSRGLLCLDLLKSRNPAEARRRLMDQNGSSYRPFNLLFADSQEACVAYNVEAEIQWLRLEKGVHVLSNNAIFDPRSEKLDRAHALCSAATRQVGGNLEASFLTLFKGILASHALGGEAKDPKAALCVHTRDYGTVSSTVIFYRNEERRFSYHHAPAPPCQGEFQELSPVAVR